VTPARRKFVLSWLALSVCALLYPWIFVALYRFDSPYEGIARAVFVVGLIGAVVSFLVTGKTGTVAAPKDTPAQYSKEDIRTALFLIGAIILGICGFVVVLQFLSPPH
jgi:hypothetical protein